MGFFQDRFFSHKISFWAEPRTLNKQKETVSKTFESACVVVAENAYSDTNMDSVKKLVEEDPSTV